jgi:hypothetical protein
VADAGGWLGVRQAEVESNNCFAQYCTTAVLTKY